MQLPFILGLTGGIACGKSQVARFLLEQGVPVLDSDQVVHELYGPGGAAVGPVERAFPGVTIDGGISRPELSKRVVGNPQALQQLEALVHPLVTAHKLVWLQEQARQGRPIVALDIPLLFETGAERHCDAVAVASCPPEVQKQRALARPGMSPEKLQAVLQRQLTDEERRRRADFVIDTGVALEETQQHVAALVEGLRGRHGTACAALLQEAGDSD